MRRPSNLIKWLEPVMVTLTNGLVRWRCPRCGGLYESRDQARRAYAQVAGNGSNWGNGHSCKSGGS